MKLNELEKAVLARFLESEGFGDPVRDLQQVDIAEREMTGVGFITKLQPNQLPVAAAPPSFTGGKVGAKINGHIDAGFLIYIKNRNIDALEGYTYGEEWPENITKFELYLIPDDNGRSTNLE